MSLRTPSRRTRTFLWGAAAAGFGLCPVDLLCAQDAPRPGILFSLGREVRGLVGEHETDAADSIRRVSAGNRADGAVKPGSMRPLNAPRTLLDGETSAARPIESAVPTAAPRNAAAIPGSRPIQQTTGQLPAGGVPGAVPAYQQPAPQQSYPPQAYPQQPVAQPQQAPFQQMPQSEVMRQLQLRYAQDGREMPVMDPAAVTPPSMVVPAAPQMAPVRNPAPDFHRQDAVASRPNFLQRIFGKRKPATPNVPPMQPQMPPAQYPQPYVAAQPKMPQQPQVLPPQQQVATQPMPATQPTPPRNVYIPPAATPTQAASQAPVVRPMTPPLQTNAPTPVAAPQAVPATPAPVATTPAPFVAQPAPTAATAAPVVAAPAKAPVEPEFRMILDAPAQAQTAPQPTATPAPTTEPAPIAAPVATPKPEATAATQPAAEPGADEFPNPFTEVSEEEADAARKNPFTGRRLDPSSAPAIQPARTATAEPARMTEPAATPAPLPVAQPQPTQSLAQPEPAARPTEQPEVQSLPTPPSVDERQAKLQKIAARQDRKGLKGFCPVALRDGRDLVDTLPEFSSVYESRLYYFSTSEAKQKFDQNPTRYAPVAGGSDVILMHETGSEVEGKLDHALWYQDRLFLFSSRDTLGRFVKHLADERAAEAADGTSDEDDKN